MFVVPSFHVVDMMASQHSESDGKLNNLAVSSTNKELELTYLGDGIEFGAGKLGKWVKVEAIDDFRQVERSYLNVGQHHSAGVGFHLAGIPQPHR